MAKIFSVEKLSINGDNIRIKSSDANKFEITDSNDSVLMSKSTIEADVDSLNTQDSTNISTVNSSIDSLSTLEAGDVSNLDADVASLNTQDSTNLAAVNSSIASLSTLEAGDVSNLDADVASLNTQDSTNLASVNSSIASLSTLEAGDVSNLDADVASLNTQDSTNLATVNSSIASVVDLIGDNDVVALSTDLAVSDGDSKTISFNRTFDSAPAVTASMQAGATDPIIGVQISAISTTECTVQFSDDIPNGNYKLKILASI